jgi:predicted nuclease of predicted toxin-antitoxin system
MILLDACTHRRYARLLIEWGYEVDFSINHIRADASDTEVLALAQELDAVLLTSDLDFSNILHYPPEEHQGVIVLRGSTNDEMLLDTVLKQALDDLYRDELRHSLVIVMSKHYRKRRF